MAITYTDNGGGAPNGSDKEFTYSFPVIQTEDVKVALNGVTQATTKYTVDNVSNPTHIEFNNTSIDSSVQETSGAPKSGVRVRVYRKTTVGKTNGDEDPKAVFAAGSSIRATDLNANQEQALFAIHELQTRPIETEDLETDSIVTTKIGDSAVIRSKIADDAIDGTKIADDVINSEHYAADSIDTEHYAPGSVDNTALGADCVTGAKIADNQINSEHYVDGSIDLLHMSAGSVDSPQLVNGCVDLVHMSFDSVDSDQLVNGSVDLSHMSANSVDSDQYIDGSIDRVHLEADIIDSTKLADNAVNSEHYVDGSIDREHLAADIVDGTKIADDAIGNEHIQANAVTDSQIATGTLDNRYYTETELDAGQLDNRYYTETELNAGQLDNRYYTETEAEALFLRQDSSETIASGVTWSNADDKVATTAAINARIIDLIDEVGGFTAITNETSFPTTNPQGATGQSAILSIQAASTTLTPQSGTTLTIANGAGTGNTVTITGVPTAIPQNFGFLVESTSTLHTYSFHRLVPIATQVNTVAQNITNIVNAGANVVDINNFADIYQISGSAPTQRADGTSLQDGDLWFDNSSDNLRVYDGTNWAIVTPAQSVLDNIAIVSGAITYSEDLGLISDAASTGSSNDSLDIVADVLEDEITFTVTAATGKFIIDGVDKPALTLYKGWTYTFDVSDASNATHPLRFYAGSSQYSTNVTVTGTQGQAGAKVQIVIPESQPTNFQYYCTNHSGMGNTITVKDDPIKTLSDISANIVSVANNSTNINLTAGSISNVNTVGASISDVNRYANEYTISANQPGSPSNGDLWFDTSNNVLKNYNGTIWAGITSNSGIASVVDDTSPQLGGALDGQNNNMSNIGTIDGANLQLDFGTI
jgi:hypothetical protein